MVKSAHQIYFVHQFFLVLCIEIDSIFRDCFYCKFLSTDFVLYQRYLRISTISNQVDDIIAGVEVVFKDDFVQLLVNSHHILFIGKDNVGMHLIFVDLQIELSRNWASIYIGIVLNFFAQKNEGNTLSFDWEFYFSLKDL